MTGTRLGQWVLETELGAGPMGTVWRARAVDPPAAGPAVAAVKLLTHPAARDAKFLARFPAEMLGLRRLTHPNLARYYDAGVHGGTAWYASELVEGTDLGTLLKGREKPAGEPGLSWRDEVLSIAAQAARALKHAHHRSILHRGLKPSNLLLTADGRLKVTDCGVAKVYDLPTLSLPGDPAGTAGFLAPEYFTGKPATRKSDLYSLGGVLYTLLAGRPPFAATSAAELMHKHCYMLPDRPMNFVPKLPADVDELVCGLLAKDPARRPASAAAFLDDLDRVRGRLERKGERIVMPPDPGDPTGSHAALPADAGRADADRWQSRGRTAVLLLLFLLIVGTMGYVFFRPRPSAEELISAARPLMQSDEPRDWDKAWEEYLDPLARRFPEQFADEVAAARAKIGDRKEAALAIDKGLKAKYGSEAERLYYRGLNLARGGDFAGARAVWRGVAGAFPAAADARWVRLSTAAADEADRKGGDGPGAADPAAAASAAEAAIDRARIRRAAGDAAAADAILTHIELLYADAPAVRDRLRAERRP